MNKTLLILGASARAAAFSAKRSGCQPSTIDLFADVDLCELGQARRVANYPNGLVDAARTSPASAWIYTGALENNADLVDRIAAERKLLGNAGDSLRRVRTPALVAEALQEDGLIYPRNSSSMPQYSKEKNWLRKPLRSAAGARIEFANSDHLPDQQSSSKWYYQEYVEGTSCSAVYVAARGAATMLGVTRQLIGTRWLGAVGFRYAGSIGPLQIDDAQQDAYSRIGNCIAKRFDLAGLFGVDVICNRAGIWPVEVNPRYTASIEVLERAASLNAIEAHVKACELGELPCGLTRNSNICGKGIVYATLDTNVPDHFPEFTMRANERTEWPRIADIPHANSHIKLGQPIATIFAEGESTNSVIESMKSFHREVLETLASR